MQRLEVSGAVRPIYGSLGVKRLIYSAFHIYSLFLKCHIVIVSQPIVGGIKYFHLHVPKNIYYLPGLSTHIYKFHPFFFTTNHFLSGICTIDILYNGSFMIYRVSQEECPKLGESVP